jgi:hypothetical protein
MYRLSAKTPRDLMKDCIFNSHVGRTERLSPDWGSFNVGNLEEKNKKQSSDENNSIINIFSFSYIFIFKRWFCKNVSSKMGFLFFILNI